MMCFEILREVEILGEAVLRLWSRTQYKLAAAFSGQVFVDPKGSSTRQGLLFAHGRDECYRL